MPQVLDRTHGALKSFTFKLPEPTFKLAEPHGGLTPSQFLIVSHRWQEPGKPDGDGTQLTCIQNHLRKHPDIQYVCACSALRMAHTTTSLSAHAHVQCVTRPPVRRLRLLAGYDYWCMPQDREDGKKKSTAENLAFGYMLQYVNHLYESMPVLILLDIDYVSRCMHARPAPARVQSSNGRDSTAGPPLQDDPACAPRVLSRASVVCGLLTSRAANLSASPLLPCPRACSLVLVRGMAGDERAGRAMHDHADLQRH